METIPFNRPYAVGTELEYVREAIAAGHLSSNGEFSRRCTRWLEERIGSRKALLTHSATGALEIAALLSDVRAGDEVVMPAFTFVTTANAFALRGAVPVFVDVDPETFTVDPAQVERAVTDRTRAVVAVHYAGVAADMPAIERVAAEHGLLVVEDAAQGILSALDGRPLGGIAPLAALSFHETKNVSCGEGGAILVNDAAFVERAEIVAEKGTNRSRFFRGEVDRYTWVDLGSSYLLSDLNAAYLWAQLEQAERITAMRMEIWTAYHDAFAALEAGGVLRRPVVPAGRTHNAHMYYVLLPDLERRTALIAHLAGRGVHAVFHYVPLHSSEAGRALGRANGDLPVTEAAGDRLLRLPLWAGMTSEHVERVVTAVHEWAATA